MASTPTLAQLVTVLAVQDGPARPLLVRLRRAVWGDIGQTRTGASRVRTIPIDGGAFDVWQEIVNGVPDTPAKPGEPGIRHLVAGATEKAPSPVALVDLLAWHATFCAEADAGEVDEVQIATQTARLQRWVDRIREYFDPSLQVPLRDFSCPNCGDRRTHYLVAGEQVIGETIVITLEDGELVARCRNNICIDLAGTRSKWVGDTEVMYMARRAGIDVEALADAVREARQPLPELPYDPDAGVKTVITPEDPAYAAEKARVAS